MAYQNLIQTLKGGRGSGNYKHKGRRGMIGGSSSGNVVAIDPNGVGTVEAWHNALGVNSIPPDDGNHYYHATTADKLKQITNDGLKPTSASNFAGFSTGDSVSLASSLSDAEYWSSMAMWRDYDNRGDGTVRRPVLLRTPKYSNVQLYRPDEIRVDKVPATDLELLNANGEWQSL